MAVFVLIAVSMAMAFLFVMFATFTARALLGLATLVTRVT